MCGVLETHSFIAVYHRTTSLAPWGLTRVLIGDTVDTETEAMGEVKRWSTDNLPIDVWALDMVSVSSRRV